MFICTLSNSNDIFIKKKYFKKRKKKKRKKRLFNSDRENKFYFESFINIMLFIIEDVLYSHLEYEKSEDTKDVIRSRKSRER